MTQCRPRVFFLGVAMMRKRIELYVFNYITLSLMAYYSIINNISILAGVIMFIISFIFLFSLVAYIFSKEEGDYHMGSAVLNTILIIIFFCIAILASAMHMPKVLYVISLILGVMFSINFISITNKNNSRE